jgi:hypothetical protein
MSHTVDVRVTHCDRCGRTVTITGRGGELGDFEWFCPYQDSSCGGRDVAQTVRQIRGPVDAVLAGLPKGPLSGES